MGTNPNSPSSATNVGMRVQGQSTTVEYVRLKKPEGVEYMLEITEDLAQWSPVMNPAVVVPDSSVADGYEKVKVSLPISAAGRVFTRLRVEISQ